MTSQIRTRRRNGFLNRVASAQWAYPNPLGKWLSGLLASRYCHQRSHALRVLQEKHGAKKELNLLLISRPNVQTLSHQCDPEREVRLDQLVPHCSALNELDLVSIWVCNKGDDGVAAQNWASLTGHLTTRSLNGGAGGIGVAYAQGNVAISRA